MWKILICNVYVTQESKHRTRWEEAVEDSKNSWKFPFQALIFTALRGGVLWEVRCSWRCTVSRDSMKPSAQLMWFTFTFERSKALQSECRCKIHARSWRLCGDTYTCVCSRPGPCRLGRKAGEVSAGGMVHPWPWVPPNRLSGCVPTWPLAVRLSGCLAQRSLGESKQLHFSLLPPVLPPLPSWSWAAQRLDTDRSLSLPFRWSRASDSRRCQEHTLGETAASEDAFGFPRGVLVFKKEKKSCTS